MRKVLFAIIFACFLLPMVQCSSDETISGFDGKMVVAASPFVKSYINLPFYLYTVQSDSLIWLYDYEPGKESRVSVITRGMVKTDTIIAISDDGSSIESVFPIENHITLGIESYFSTNPSILPIKINPDGTFIDTIFISSSPVSELILLQNSRLFIAADDFIDDIIPLTNPHSIK